MNIEENIQKWNAYSCEYLSKYSIIFKVVWLNIVKYSFEYSFEYLI